MMSRLLLWAGLAALLLGCTAVAQDTGLAVDGPTLVFLYSDP